MHQYQVDNLIAISASFVIVLTITIIVIRAWRRAFEAEHELRRQLIDKMAPEEIARILSSPDGGRAIAALTGGAGTDSASGAIGRGVTLILIGLGLGLSAALSHLPMVGAAGLVSIGAGIGQLVLARLMSSANRT
ncbi:MAG TPA: hypothetical protein VGJ88_04495 [Thermoanaerobaculia bacterium]